ncbi:MAG: hypothetical protein RL557_523 [archaeon]
MVVYIASAIITIIFGVLWIFSLFSTSELAIVARYFLGFLTVLGVIATLGQIFLISKLYYVRLTDRQMVVSVGYLIPTRVNYSDIKRISFSHDMLKGIDAGWFINWPILLQVENHQLFLKDLSRRYQKSTGKKLIITPKF